MSGSELARGGVGISSKFRCGYVLACSGVQHTAAFRLQEAAVLPAGRAMDSQLLRMFRQEQEHQQAQQERLLAYQLH